MQESHAFRQPEPTRDASTQKTTRKKEPFQSTNHPKHPDLYAQLWGNGVPPDLRLSGPAVRPEKGATQEHREPVQRKENTTGLPDALKEGIEQISHLSLDDVQVKYHSSKPAEVQALAYTQGSEIHVGPGQERHLPHEAWHVVQQKQGRVKPTIQMRRGAINDDAGLEREADMMGAVVQREGKTTHQKENGNRQGTEKGDSYERPPVPAARESVIQRFIGSDVNGQLKENGIDPIGRFLEDDITDFVQNNPPGNNERLVDYFLRLKRMLDAISSTVWEKDGAAIRSQVRLQYPQLLQALKRPNPTALPPVPKRANLGFTSLLTDKDIEDFVEKNPPAPNDGDNYITGLQQLFIGRGGDAQQFAKRVEPVARIAVRIARLAAVREATEEMKTLENSGDLSEDETSDTEVKTTRPGNDYSREDKIIRVNTYRDALKALRKLKKVANRIYVRIGVGGPVFEIEKRGQTNVFLTSIDPEEEKPERRPTTNNYEPVGVVRKLKKGDQPGEGYKTKSSSTYTYLGKKLEERHSPQEVASAITNKFASKTPYPDTFSTEEKETLDELFALLFIVEVYRTGFAGPLAFASVQAMLNGVSIKNVLYKGAGQAEALHVGTSQASQEPKISGQEAERKVGTGDLKKGDFNKALQRTLELFGQASQSNDPVVFADLFRKVQLETIRSQKRRVTI